MADLRTGYGCPLCERTTGDTNEIIARDGRSFVCSKVPAHAWADSDELGNMEPKIRFQQQQERPAPQPNHTSVSVSISVPAYNALLARYGDRMGATLSSIAGVMAEGEPMIISEEDVQQIALIPGIAEKPKNARHLIGLIFAMQEQVREAKQIAETAAGEIKAYENMAPGKVVIDLGEQNTYALDRAKNEGLPLKVWLQTQIQNALASAWF